MAKVSNPGAAPGPQRPGRYPGRFLVARDPWGRPHVRTWPRNRGSKATAQQIFARNQFDTAGNWSAHPLGMELDTLLQLAAHTPWTWRDLQMCNVYGYGVEATMADGSTLGSMRELSQQAQDYLDSITTQWGSMLLRTSAGWIGLEPGAAQDVLTIDPLTGWPDWQPPAGSGITGIQAIGYRAPNNPKSANFSFETDSQGSPTLTDYATFGFNLTRPAADGTNMTLFGQAAPTATPWTLIAGYRVNVSPNFNYFNTGIYLRNTSNAKLLTTVSALSSGSTVLQANHWNSSTSYNSSPYSEDATGQSINNPVYFKCVCDGSTYAFAFSSDGICWVPYYSEAITNWLPSAADRIGIYLDPEHNDASLSMSLSLYDWSIE